MKRSLHSSYCSKNNNNQIRKDVHNSIQLENHKQSLCLENGECTRPSLLKLLLNSKKLKSFLLHFFNHLVFCLAKFFQFRFVVRTEELVFLKEVKKEIVGHKQKNPTKMHVLTYKNLMA